MSHQQRQYVDNEAATHDQHMLERSIGGNTADASVVQSVGDRLDFGGSATGTVFDKVSAKAFQTDTISCDGFEHVVVKVETEKSNPDVRLRPWWKDASGTGWTPGDEIRAKATGDQGGSGSVPGSLVTNYYHFERLVLETHGASEVKFELTKISNGKVSAPRSRAMSNANDYLRRGDVARMAMRVYGPGSGGATSETSPPTRSPRRRSSWRSSVSTRLCTRHGGTSFACVDGCRSSTTRTCRPGVASSCCGATTSTPERKTDRERAEAWCARWIEEDCHGQPRDQMTDELTEALAAVRRETVENILRVLGEQYRRMDNDPALRDGIEFHDALRNRIRALLGEEA